MAFVGETRQRVRNFVHVDFRLSAPWILPDENCIDDAAKLALVEKLRGSPRSPR